MTIVETKFWLLCVYTHIEFCKIHAHRNGLLQGLSSKESATQQEMQVLSLCWEDPLEKEMATHSSILPRESHGQRSLAGYSPRDRKESDTTERLDDNSNTQQHLSYLLAGFKHNVCVSA